MAVKVRELYCSLRSKLPEISMVAPVMLMQFLTSRKLEGANDASPREIAAHVLMISHLLPDAVSNDLQQARAKGLLLQIVQLIRCDHAHATSSRSSRLGHAYGLQLQGAQSRRRRPTRGRWPRRSRQEGLAAPLNVDHKHAPRGEASATVFACRQSVQRKISWIDMLGSVHANAMCDGIMSTQGTSISCAEITCLALKKWCHAGLNKSQGRALQGCGGLNFGQCFNQQWQVVPRNRVCQILFPQ